MATLCTGNTSCGGAAMSLSLAITSWLNAPAALPSASLTAAWMHLGWSLVLAWLGAWIAAWIGARVWAGNTTAQQRSMVSAALLLAAWAWVPGPWGASYWLGLAFQGTSVLTAALVAMGLWRLWRGTNAGMQWMSGYSVGAIVLGWILLLDSFAVWPVSLYSLGFEPGTVAACVMVMVLLPLAVGGRAMASNGWRLLLLVLCTYVVLRLPSGNVWDALLDPWAWVALQVGAIAQWLQRRSAIRRGPVSR